MNPNHMILSSIAVSAETRKNYGPGISLNERTSVGARGGSVTIIHDELIVEHGGEAWDWRDPGYCLQQVVLTLGDLLVYA